MPFSMGHRNTWGLCEWKKDDPTVRNDLPCLCLNQDEHSTCICMFCGNEEKEIEPKDLYLGLS